MAIALLGAIESLLSAVVADGMAGTRHDPDAELLAQGTGNLIAPFFGGFAATGAIARTATNIRNGARSPISAVVHSLFTLAVVIFFSQQVSELPLAALAALLILVAYNMSEARHFLKIIRVAPRSDVVVLLTCFGLTVWFDMVVGVSIGMILAALIFMKKMSETTETTIPAAPSHGPDTVVFELAGPLFFGAAKRAMQALHEIGTRKRNVVLSLRRVTLLDVSGLIALESAVDQIRRDGSQVTLESVSGPVREILEKSELLRPLLRQP
jgi:SulP family sulfate permease